MTDNNKIQPRSDVVRLIKRHLKNSMYTQFRPIPYSVQELNDLLLDVIDLLKSEETLAVLEAPILVVGDLHGQYADLIRILHIDPETMDSRFDKAPYATTNYLFLGDYVDRGVESMQILVLLFSLKILYGNVTLLRGNHETPTINSSYGFRDEILDRFGEKHGEQLWRLFNEVFTWLPVTAVISERIVCMHGGLSPDLHSLNDIKNLKRPLCDLTNPKFLLDLLWSDAIPKRSKHYHSKKPIYRHNKTREMSFEYNKVAIKEKCKELDVDLVLRGHQLKNEGFEIYSKQFMTVFSCPNYADNKQNDGSVCYVTCGGEIVIIQLRKMEVLKNEKEEEEEETREFVNDTGPVANE